MHLLHNYIAHNLADHLRKARVVVWYDLPGDYHPSSTRCAASQLPRRCRRHQLEPVQVEGLTAALCCYAGSFLAVRLAVEDRVAGERPEPLLILRTRRRLRRRELIAAGTGTGGHALRTQPQARRRPPAAAPQLSDAAIDELFAAPGLTTPPWPPPSNGGRGGPSALRLALPDDADTAQMLTHWLADPATDTAIAGQQPRAELYQLVACRLGLALAAGTDLVTPRAWSCAICC